MRAILLISLLAGCGDSIDTTIMTPDAAPDAPAESIDTWGDAWGVWGMAWCDLAERCQPEDFLNNFPGGKSECIAHVREINCEASSHPCDEPYERTRLPSLEQCAEEMSNLACGVTDPPAPCFAAFQ